MKLRGSIIGITAATMAAAFMALADISIVNVNLPQMQVAFGVEIDQLGWVSTAYMIANVIAMPMTGWLQRRLGFRASFLLSLATFTLGSALCGAAWSFESLVAFRALQGLGGGGLLPLAQSILMARYPDEKLELAGAFFGVGAMLGPVVGPFFGAQLLEVFSWPWVFWVNVPIGVVAAAITFASLEEPAFIADRRPFDAVGAFLLASGLSTMQFVLEEGNRRDWFDDAWIASAAIVSVVSLGGLIVHTTSTAAPIVDLRVFRSRRLVAASSYNLLLGGWMIGGGFLNALYFSNVLGLPPLRIGELLFVGNLSDFVVLPASAWIFKRSSAPPMVIAGVFLIALGFWMNAVLGLDAGFWDLVIPQLVRSAGASLLYVPVTIVAVDRLSDEQRESAVGLFNLMREIGGSIAIAVFAHLLITRGAAHRDGLASAMTAAGALEPGQAAETLRLAERLAERGVFADVFTIGAIALAPFFLLVGWVKGRGDRPDQAASSTAVARPLGPEAAESR